MDKVPNQSRLVFALHALLWQLVQKDLELMRPCRTGSLMLLSGVTANSMPPLLITKVLSEQRDDGGWVGSDDTMWSLLYLRLVGQTGIEPFQKGLNWLKSNRSSSLGWGRSVRDMARIPITGRILYFLPEIVCEEYLEGLEQLWKKECNALTYKAAFTLAAIRAAHYHPSEKGLIEDTVSWLVSQQNSDGGFAPWQNHPAGSDIYSTAVALLGIAGFREFVDDTCISQALSWMSGTQLRTGLWPYHQIEDGGSWGLLAAHSVQTN
jgi:hypothetical protein